MYAYHATSQQPAAVVFVLEDGTVERRLYARRYEAERAVLMISQAQEADVEEAARVVRAKVVDVGWTWN